MKNESNIKYPVSSIQYQASSNQLLNNKVLIIDDEQVVIDSIRKHLEREGCEIISALDGKEGLEIYDKEQPGLIILDLKMPHMDGIEFLEHIRLKPSDSYSVIVLTGHCSDEDIEKCFKLGITAFLRKPLNVYELIGLVKHSIALKQTQQKLMVKISEHRQAVEELWRYRDHLESMVEDRTIELKDVNQKLEKEIEERKLAEVALRESEEKFRNISISAQDAIIMANNEENISYWNEAAQRIFGYSKEEAIGKTIHELIIPNRYHKDHLKGYRRFLETGQGTFIGNTVELTAIKKDRKELPIELSLSAVKMKDKWNAIGIIRDISERKSIEEQLRMSYKMASLGRLTAGVFHEVLNPVNIISSHVQLLLIEAEKGSRTEEDLNSIQEEVKRIVKIIDGLLRFARKGKLITEEVDTNSLLEKILSIVEPDMKLENVRFIRRFEEGLPKIMANSDQLRQVFLNLITNARDAMPEGGALTISTQSIQKEGNSFVSIRFMDTGCGIAKENLDRVFDPFFTTKGEGKGVGLGMSTSYGIIDHYGGRISVESEEGKGTTFTIDLPVKD
ncbi:MAG: two-component sensor kinase [Candidatus Scalindua rubra]|uniref:histidine kinase n=1 Tax=Candidatus Scalindua rubra TaxID=1872076 RepID=A0A1E3XFB9_9BACT|nr:MAG: two-component sensor kinase [Candidatus Scalindua rubra]